MHIRLIGASEGPHHVWASPCVRDEGWVFICLLWNCAVFVDSYHVFTCVCFLKMSLFPNKKRFIPFLDGIRLFIVMEHDRRLTTEDLGLVWLPRSERQPNGKKNKQKLWYLGQKIMNCDVMCSWRLPVGLLISWNGINSLWHFCKVIILISWQLHIVPGCLSFSFKTPIPNLFWTFQNVGTMNQL